MMRSILTVNKNSSPFHTPITPSSSSKPVFSNPNSSVALQRFLFTLTKIDAPSSTGSREGSSYGCTVILPASNKKRSPQLRILRSHVALTSPNVIVFIVDVHLHIESKPFSSLTNEERRRAPCCSRTYDSYSGWVGSSNIRE